MAKEQTDREYDSSALVWEMYRIIYEGGMLSNVFEIKKYNPKIKRNYAEIQVKDCKSSIYKIFSGDVWNAMSKPKGTRASLSGDVIFNFTYSKNKSCQFYIYKNWINQDQNPIRKNKYLNLLNKCRSMHHSFENCALMLQQGNLQNAKQGIGKDRGDTFIWALDEYYKGKSEMVLNHATQQNSGILREFLNYFDDVYEYCEVFYNITDKGFIDRLIQSGSKALDSADKVENYIDLALRFWDERAEFMKKKYKEDRKKVIPKDEVFNTKSENVINKLNENNAIDITNIKKCININDEDIIIDDKILEENIKSCIINQTKETVKDYVIRVEKELYNGCQQYEESELYKEIIIYDCKCALKDLLMEFVCKEDEQKAKQLIDTIQNNNKNLNELYRSLLEKCKNEQVNKINKKIHSVSNNDNRKSVKECEAEINMYYEELLNSFPCDEKTKVSQSENPSSTPTES